MVLIEYFLRFFLGFFIDFFVRIYFIVKKVVLIILNINSDVKLCVYSRDNGLDMSNMYSGFLFLIFFIVCMILLVKDDIF